MHNHDKDPNGLPREQRWTLPNALCVARLAGSPVLLVLAVLEYRTAFLILLIPLILTDWIDGILARQLHQRTEFGAMLDSIADATLNMTILFSACWLEWEFVRGQWIWILAIVVSYAVACAVCRWKFARFPNYHTLLAKLGMAAMGVAAIMIFANLEYRSTVFQLASSIVIVGNIETLVITRMLARWRTDVWSVFRLPGKDTADSR